MILSGIVITSTHQREDQIKKCAHCICPYFNNKSLIIQIEIIKISGFCFTAIGRLCHLILQKESLSQAFDDVSFY